jgi:hypothetical protein
MTRATYPVAGGLLIAGLAVFLFTGPLDGASIVVGPGDDLQAALDRAQPGDVVQLEAGATFDGNFVLPQKTGTAYVTIRTSTPDARLPGTNTRIGPDYESLMPTLRAPNASPALRTAPGANHWRILGVRFVGTGGGDVVALGDGTQRDRALVPTNLVLDRVVVRGDLTKGQHRGISLNSASTIIRNSYIVGIRLAGQETQAIAGWNGPGPFLLENNYVEAGSIGILFGGAEPAIDQLVPSDIVVRRNQITRPVEWRSGKWGVKNLFELKNARRVTVQGNLLEYNWADAQAGPAILFTPRVNGSRATWTTVETVRFENNVVRHVGAAINILGSDTNATSQQAHDLVIRNNLFTDVNGPEWGGNGTFVQIGDSPADVHIEHNTVLQTGNVISVYGGTRAAPKRVEGFRFANNIVLHNNYGIYGDQIGTGNPAITQYFPGAVITGNVLAGGDGRLYPSGNVFPTVAELMKQFENAAADDFRLVGGSALRALAQGSAGADFDEMKRAMEPTPRAIPR